MNENQALIARLRDCLSQLPLASASEVLAQTTELEKLVGDAKRALSAGGNPDRAELLELRHLFTTYAQAITRSQARVSRALGVLGHDDLVYAESERPGRAQLPVTGVRRTSLIA